MQTQRTSGFIPAAKQTIPWEDAWKKYHWPDQSVGLCIPRNDLLICIMAEKHAIFRIKRGKMDYAIDPEEALALCKQYSSYFTNKYGKLIAVIPKSACYSVKKGSL